jgi:1-acyl-sn-glycerol-3-phosphate acyltransferase
MQNIIIAKPYRFVPPYPGEFWVRIFRYYLRHYLWSRWGLRSAELRGVEHLESSLAAGHGIILAPNHCRPFDPMAMGLLGMRVNRAFHAMASWHLFMGSRFQRWLIRRLGAFSVYREGTDREALRAATDILVKGRRPLIVLPEGIVTRTNDRLSTLQEGVAFIARLAATQRARATPPGAVVIHPIALKYFFEGDLEATVAPVLEEIERRLSWRHEGDRPVLERICKVGEGLLTLKEIEYFGQAQTGRLAERLAALLERLLVPLEKEWLNGPPQASVIERVKRLRSAIVSDLATANLDERERGRRWNQLADLYLAQQLWCYPPDYLDGRPSPSPERLLETVERFEEDLTDEARIHRPLRLVMQVGPALVVQPERGRNGADDPLMPRLEASLNAMLCELASLTPARQPALPQEALR